MELRYLCPDFGISSMYSVESWQPSLSRGPGNPGMCRTVPTVLTSGTGGEVGPVKDSNKYVDHWNFLLNWRKEERGGGRESGTLSDPNKWRTIFSPPTGTDLHVETILRLCDVRVVGGPGIVRRDTPTHPVPFDCIYTATTTRTT